MKNKVSFLLLSLTCQLFIAFNSSASNPIKNSPSARATNLMHQSKALFFEENKGQLMDEKYDPITDVKYYGHSNGVNVYFKQGMISFVFTRLEKDENAVSEATGNCVETQCLRLNYEQANHSLRRDAFNASLQKKISTSQMDLVLINSNPSARITASAEQKYYENFYTTGNADHGITNVHTYKIVTYKNIYPKIDMIFEVKGTGMEYSFAVHSGGKVSDIKLRWDGSNRVNKMANGGIRHNNFFGYIKEGEPKSFVDGKNVQSGFVKKGINYGFAVPNYDKTKELIIDPSLIWATYFGDVWGNEYDAYFKHHLGVDTLGNLYFAANVIGISGRFAKPGPEITITKIGADDSLIWGTYFGSYGNDQAVGLSLDDSANIYVTGSTISQTGIATKGAYQTSFGGKTDIFLAKFNNGGILNWATYYGGADYDFVNRISFNHQGAISLAGYTYSDTGIASTGAYETKLIGTGEYNSFLAEFSEKGKLDWATYFGDYPSQAIGVSSDNNGNTYIAGETSSLTNISTSGAFQTSAITGVDNQKRYIAKFNKTGNLDWATYFGNYGGSIQAISADFLGNVYITGSIGDSSGIIMSGTYQTSYGGDVDAYLAKFTPSGNLAWASFYGGESVEFGNDLYADNSGNIYMTGYTESNTGIATAGAFQTSHGGGVDGFLAKFNYQGNLAWATYFGGKNLDCINTVIPDVFKNVYVAGFTSDSGLATSGAFQTNFEHYPVGDLENEFIARFSIPDVYYNDAGIDSIKNPSGTICAGSLPVTVNLHNYGFNELKSANIGLSINGIIQKSYSWHGNLGYRNSENVTIGNYYFPTGSDSIRVWAYDPNNQIDSLSTNDTSETVLTSREKANADWSVKNIGDRYYFQVKDSSFDESSYVWDFGDSTSIVPGYQVSHTYKRTGIYDVKLQVVNKILCPSNKDSLIDITMAGIDENKLAAYGITIYPNPFTDKTLINFTLPQASHAKISVMDMKGNVLFVPTDKTLNSGPNEIEINASEAQLSPGTYFVNIMIDDQVISKKIIEVK